MEETERYNLFTAKFILGETYKESYENTIKLFSKSELIKFQSPTDVLAKIEDLLNGSSLYERILTSNSKPNDEGFAQLLSEDKIYLTNLATVDALYDSGIYKFTIIASDENPCDYCKSMNGKTFSMFEEHNLPPFHPNCKCRVVPITEASLLKSKVEPINTYLNQTLSKTMPLSSGSQKYTTESYSSYERSETTSSNNNNSYPTTDSSKITQTNTNKTSSHNPYKYLGISDSDYNAYIKGTLTKNDLLSIAQSVALYNAAKKQGSYYYMNVAHNQAAQTRMKYDKNYIKNDKYDNTYGGKFNPDKPTSIPNNPPKFETPTKLITQSHLDIIESTKGLKPKKGTDEWDFLQSSVWYVDKFRGQGDEKIKPFKDQWINGYRDIIKEAAKKYNIPDFMLAQVIHIEVGGAPLLADYPVYFARSAGIKANGHDVEDKTSFGNTSMQVITAAQTLGYDVENLTLSDKIDIVNLLMNAVQGVFITALHLSQLKEYDFEGKDINDLTEAEINVMVLRYNQGLRRDLEYLLTDYDENTKARFERMRELLKD